jgi:dTDP-4-amino-4,6-dideoxygalactose transaminase
VFVDIEPDTFNLDVRQVAEAVTPRTKAIIPVHLYGHACDMDPLMELAKAKGIRIIEDVAQAFGSEHKGCKVASIGDAGCLSFFPSKNLGAFGDGGMVVTNDDAVAEMVRTLRVHGARKKYFNEVQGYNSRLDTLQAAILAVKLPHIDEANEGRRRVAKRYNEGLAGVAGVQTPVEAPYTKHVYHQYTIRVKNGRRDEVQAKLKDAGVQTFVYYPVPLHRLPLYDLPEGSFPKAEQAASEALSLPIWPKLDESTQDRVIAAIRTVLG